MFKSIPPGRYPEAYRTVQPGTIHGTFGHTWRHGWRVRYLLGAELGGHVGIVGNHVLHNGVMLELPFLNVASICYNRKVVAKKTTTLGRNVGKDTKSTEKLDVAETIDM